MNAPHVAVVTSCPRCAGRLHERHNRQDGSAFLGCENFPRCRWTAPHDADMEALALEVLRLQRAASERVPEIAPRGVTTREVRDLLAWAHPDKHPSGHVNAHELAVRLTSLLSRARAA